MEKKKRENVSRSCHGYTPSLYNSNTMYILRASVFASCMRKRVISSRNCESRIFTPSSSSSLNPLGLNYSRRERTICMYLILLLLLFETQWAFCQLYYIRLFRWNYLSDQRMVIGLWSRRSHPNKIESFNDNCMQSIAYIERVAISSIFASSLSWRFKWKCLNFIQIYSDSVPNHGYECVWRNETKRFLDRSSSQFVSIFQTKIQSPNGFYNFISIRNRIGNADRVSVGLLGANRHRILDATENNEFYLFVAALH